MGKVPTDCPLALCDAYHFRHRLFCFTGHRPLPAGPSPLLEISNDDPFPVRGRRRPLLSTAASGAVVQSYDFNTDGVLEGFGSQGNSGINGLSVGVGLLSGNANASSNDPQFNLEQPQHHPRLRRDVHERDLPRAGNGRRLHQPGWISVGNCPRGRNHPAGHRWSERERATTANGGSGSAITAIDDGDGFLLVTATLGNQTLSGPHHQLPPRPHWWCPVEQQQPDRRQPVRDRLCSVQRHRSHSRARLARVLLGLGGLALLGRRRG